MRSPTSNGWSGRLSRWGAPVTYLSVVALVGLTLVGILTRSPDTKSNYQESPEDYHRTALASLGATDQYLGLSGALAGDGQSLFVGAGCAGCHGEHGAGGTVGPAIWTLDAKKLKDGLRADSPAMPAFPPERLSDEQISTLAAYLQDLRARYPDEQERKPARSRDADASKAANAPGTR